MPHSIPVEYRNVVKIAASRCCICRLSLTDPVSLQSGIGPICSRKYYSDEHVPSQEEVEKAVGLLAAADIDSKIDPDVITACMDYVKTDKANGRKISSLLLYYASANYAKREVVLACAGIVRALGYTELADRLEIDRVKASITLKDNGYICYLPGEFSFTKNLKAIPGVTPFMVEEEIEDNRPIKEPDAKPQTRMVQDKIGPKFGWVVPKDRLGHLETLLGCCFHGELATYGNSVIKTIPYRSWHDLKRFTQPPALIGARPSTCLGRQCPGCTTCCRVTHPGGGKIQVYSPYNDSFRAAVRALGDSRVRRWTGQFWEVDANQEPAIKALIQQHYKVTI